MSRTHRIVIAILLALALLAGLWLFGTRATTVEIDESFSETPSPTPPPTSTDTTSTDPADLTPEWGTATMTVSGVVVRASVADDEAERAAGLSGVPALAPDAVKLFVFPETARWSFWMKDMRFAIDIIWADAAGTIVHIAPNVTPETYPESFLPPVPARYVVEAVAGFAATHGVVVGDTLTLPRAW